MKPLFLNPEHHNPCLQLSAIENLKNMAKNLVLLCCILLFSVVARPQDRPNILWLVTEDFSPHLSCYGNTTVKTPNLDALAGKGIRFTNAYSNGAQCSPARSTIISGIYAVTTGTDMHRGVRKTDPDFFFPIHLRKAGYYCTNNAKEDYNAVKPEKIWDESNRRADYTNRKNKTQPFFSVFNYGGTHMSRVATRTVDGRNNRTVSPATVKVPAYIPDLPEVRDDIAWNMDAAMKMDEWMGEQLQRLEKSGEAENTIIFFYGDHGGTVPRGKAYVYESGTNIPMIVYFPKKWQHLAGTSLPQVSDRLVSFVDLAPTVLQLAGVKTPQFMQGKPFLTEISKQTQNIRKSVFCFTANQGPTYKPSRAISDGKYQLIWNFQSGYANGSRQDYQWQMPAQMAWEQAYLNGNLKNNLHKSFWLPVTQLELYDIVNDEEETRNLAGDPKYKNVLEQIKKDLLDEIYRQKDLGLMPPEYRMELEKEQGALYHWANKNTQNVKEAIDAAVVASAREAKNIDKLVAMLQHKNPAVKYWGASGLNGLAKVGLLKETPSTVKNLFKDSSQISELRCMLAEILIYTEQNRDALNYFLSLLRQNYKPAIAAMQNIGNLAAPVTDQIQVLLNQPKPRSAFYLTSMLINTGKIPYQDLYRYTGSGAEE